MMRGQEPGQNPGQISGQTFKKKKRIAVIGSGISGLSAAWLLSKSCEIDLYEQEGRAGGHSHTFDVPVNGKPVPVDTGFIVYNERNYPNLIALFAHLSVATKSSNMSFAASMENGSYEYAGGGFSQMFAQKRNLLRPRMWKLIRDLLRLHKLGTELVNDQSLSEVSLGEFLDGHKFSAAFQNDHILPMCAAIWSAPIATMREYPALSFLRFFHNHGLLSLNNRPKWRTVIGGSRAYVKRLLADFDGQVLLNTKVSRVQRENDSVLVFDDNGHGKSYDDVVLAVHGDQALQLLGDCSPEEQAVLSGFRYQTNKVYLHSDTKLMPRLRAVWSSWNYMCSGQGSKTRLSVSYWMNRLQQLDTERDIFVTLNPDQPPEAELTYFSTEYEHPIFDAQAMQAQAAMSGIQGKQQTWFCGAWFGSGFHEDGLQSGLAVAEALGGIARPWEFENVEQRICWDPQFENPASKVAAQ
jgi:predicted NAD/FAD-binding protein